MANEAVLERAVGRRARKAVAQAKAEAEKLGLNWSDMKKLRRAFGVPGEHPESRKAWLKLAKDYGGPVLGVAPRAIDWEALADFIERVLPIIIAAFSGC